MHQVGEGIASDVTGVSRTRPLAEHGEGVGVPIRGVAVLQVVLLEGLGPAARVWRRGSSPFPLAAGAAAAGERGGGEAADRDRGDGANEDRARAATGTRRVTEHLGHQQSA